MTYSAKKGLWTCSQIVLIWTRHKIVKNLHEELLYNYLRTSQNLCTGCEILWGDLIDFKRREDI